MRSPALPNRFRSVSLLAAILLLAAAFARLPGLGQGIPDGLHPDETVFVHRALYFGSGDLNPHLFHYPSFFMYVTAAIIGSELGVERLGGRWKTLDDLKNRFVQSPDFAYLAARAGSAFFSILTCMLLFIWGKKWVGSAPAFFAALLAALSPAVIDQARIAKPDSLMALLGVLSFFAACEADSRRSSRWLLISAAFGGLAVSTKYNAIPFLIPALWAAFRMDRARTSFPGRWILSVLLISLLAFFAGTPYAILDTQTFLSDLRSVQRFTASGVPAAHAFPFFPNLGALLWTMGGTPALGIPLSAILLSGLRRDVSPLPRAFRFSQGVVLGFLLLVASQRLAFPRYFDPVLPILFLSAFTILFACYRTCSKRGTHLLLALTTVWLIGTATLLSAQLVHSRLRPYSKTLAKEWILRNCPAGAKILTDAGGPALPLVRSALEELLAKTRLHGHIKSALFELQLRHYDTAQKHFDVYLSSQPYMQTPPDLLEKSRSIQRLVNLGDGASKLMKDRFSFYVCADSERLLYTQPDGWGRLFPRTARFYDTLDQTPGMTKVFDTSSDSAVGPRIRIYQFVYRNQKP